MLCQDLFSKNSSRAEQAVRALANVPDFGLLDQHTLTESIEQIRSEKIAQSELFQAELNVIDSHLTQQLKDIVHSSKATGPLSWRDKILHVIESFFDPGQAIKRRKKAKRIYKDLAHGQISVDRAAYELQSLNYQQKGGWLRAGVQRKLRG